MLDHLLDAFNEADSEMLLRFLPSVEAAKEVLFDPPQNLEPSTLEKGKRVLDLIHLIHMALLQLEEMILMGKSQHNEVYVQWLIEEYIQMVRESYENLLVFVVQDHAEDPSAAESTMDMLTQNFRDSLTVCRNEMDHIHLTEEEEPSMESEFAAGGSYRSSSFSEQEGANLSPSLPSFSEQGTAKRKSNYLTSHLGESSKRFRSDDTEKDS